MNAREGAVVSVVGRDGSVEVVTLEGGKAESLDLIKYLQDGGKLVKAHHGWRRLQEGEDESGIGVVGLEEGGEIVIHYFVSHAHSDHTRESLGGLVAAVKEIEGVMTVYATETTKDWVGVSVFDNIDVTIIEPDTVIEMVYHIVHTLDNSAHLPGAVLLDVSVKEPGDGPTGAVVLVDAAASAMDAAAAAWAEEAVALEKDVWVDATFVSGLTNTAVKNLTHYAIPVAEGWGDVVEEVVMAVGKRKAVVYLPLSAVAGGETELIWMQRCLATMGVDAVVAGSEASAERVTFIDEDTNVIRAADVASPNVVIVLDKETRDELLSSIEYDVCVDVRIGSFGSSKAWTSTAVVTKPRTWLNVASMGFVNDLPSRVHIHAKLTHHVPLSRLIKTLPSFLAVEGVGAHWNARLVSGLVLHGLPNEGEATDLRKRFVAMMTRMAVDQEAKARIDLATLMDFPALVTTLDTSAPTAPPGSLIHHVHCVINDAVLLPTGKTKHVLERKGIVMEGQRGSVGGAVVYFRIVPLDHNIVVPTGPLRVVVDVRHGVRVRVRHNAVISPPRSPPHPSPPQPSPSPIPDELESVQRAIQGLENEIKPATKTEATEANTLPSSASASGESGSGGPTGPTSSSSFSSASLPETLANLFAECVTQTPQIGTALSALVTTWGKGGSGGGGGGRGGGGGVEDEEDEEAGDAGVGSALLVGLVAETDGVVTGVVDGIVEHLLEVEQLLLDPPAGKSLGKAEKKVVADVLRNGVGALLDVLGAVVNEMASGTLGLVNVLGHLGLCASVARDSNKKFTDANRYFWPFLDAA